MLDPQTVYLISIGQYTPTFKETREMARILYAQECSRQALMSANVLIESNVQIGQA